MGDGERIAQVVVDVPARSLSEPFDYRVPERLIPEMSVGRPVAVPFGGRRCVGYVTGLGVTTAFEGSLKDIEGILGVPVFDERALALARWIASEYLAPLAEALKLFLPPGGAPRVERAPDGSWHVVGRQLAPAEERLVALTGASYEPRPNAHVQRAVLGALSAGPVTVAELSVDIPGAAAAVSALERVGAVSTFSRRTYRRPEIGAVAAPRHPHTEEQAAAVAAIDRMRRGGGGTVLLDGITGSGKTEVYLAAIEAAVADGASAIVLVPEISLTPQTVGRFRARLGDDVAVIHSRLSAGERFDQWQLALEGRVRVVVGARSALFAPVSNLGLVVIDEEHEPSYKQGSSPRYHARDVAARLCHDSGAVLVLGSATPSLESLEAASRGELVRLRLTRRVGGGAPPAVMVVDMTAEFAAGHRSMYSRALTAALTSIAERGEKAVLYLNRRGYASFLLCRECGFVPRCSSCSVSLTYHENDGTVRCHHCGASAAAPVTCPRCGSAYLRRFGAGTQRAQAELSSLVPTLPVVRMDADTTARKGGHERALRQFEDLESGVLLGTQMIAKGLDYPDVTLVGVLNADTSMHMPDFRAAERTYQLLEQVAGRAGRGPKGGRVIVQTYWPDHPAIRAVATGDSEALYAAERADRAALRFPPFGRLVNITFSGADTGAVRDAAETLALALRSGADERTEVIGPAPSPLERLKGHWRWHVLVKSDRTAPVSVAVGDALAGYRPPAAVGVVIDVDPLTTL